jgi:hypothetical protein
MQIQLKQAEIVAALKMFIASQGFAIEGKQVDITFTASRKANGFIADVSINDVVIPGYTDATDVAQAEVVVAEKAAPALAVVKTLAPVANAVAQAEVAAPEVVAAAEAAPAEEAAAKPAAPTTSLFS